MEWEVSVAKTVSGSVIVEADSAEDAEREALDQAPYADYDEGTATYELEIWKRAEHENYASAHPHTPEL